MSQLYKSVVKLQEKLDSMEPRSPEQNIVRDYGMKRLNSQWTPHKRALVTTKAYFLPDQLTQYADDTVEIDSAILTATVPNLVAANLGMRQIISLRCIEPTILGPSLELEASLVGLDMDMSGADTVLPIGERLRRPLYVPVENIEFITITA